MNPDQILCTVRTGSNAGLFRHDQPTAHLVRIQRKKFAAFFRQIAPIGLVLPTYPANKSFAVNKMGAQCYLDPVAIHPPAVDSKDVG
jgi:hypothetical protein